MVNSMWCGHDGDCAAGGYYIDASGDQQAFVVTETNGLWGQAVTTASSDNTGGSAAVVTIWCVGIGVCTAGGYYTDANNNQEAFVVQESTTWGAAQEVAGSLNVSNSAGNGTAAVDSISCSESNGCAAGGYYAEASGNIQSFVIDNNGGPWTDALEVPGGEALNTGGDSFVTAISCSSFGNCSAGGIYSVGTTQAPAFVMSEVDGQWGTAIEVPGLSSIGATAGVVGDISCGSAGNCGAVGDYLDASSNSQGFVESETNGTWGSALEVPGLAALNAGNAAAVRAVSCSAVGDCGAGGVYTDKSGVPQAFVVDEVNGTWGSAAQVSGTNSVDDPGAAVNDVSCTTPGDCMAGGGYSVGSKESQAFVVQEVDGTWASALAVPGSTALNAGINATVYAVSCSSDLSCGVGGEYADSSNNSQAMVANYNVLPITYPGIPREVTVKVVGPGEVKVSWLAPLDDGNSPINGYSASRTPATASASPRDCRARSRV